MSLILSLLHSGKNVHPHVISACVPLFQQSWHICCGHQPKSCIDLIVELTSRPATVSGEESKLVSLCTAGFDIFDCLVQTTQVETIDNFGYTSILLAMQ
mmetsp:Transcript_34289/g.54043  ORF Transcript_34289/g.54043 Transcript_34289/m.54043 type:complete len:99 (-) Transcript_34289:552-848(-)